jgi:hypothetical protein
MPSAEVLNSLRHGSHEDVVDLHMEEAGAVEWLVMK